MNRFLLVILLTVVWAALFATTDLRALAFGALMGAIIVGFVAYLQSSEERREFAILPRPIGLTILAFAFVRELVLSAVSVTREVWRPRLAIRPGILAIPLEVETDLQITLLASLISLTPGTLSMEVSPDRKQLFVHALVVEGSGGEIRAAIQARLERPVKRAFRVVSRKA